MRVFCVKLWTRNINYLHGICPTNLGSRRQELLRESKLNKIWPGPVRLQITADMGLTTKGATERCVGMSWGKCFKSKKKSVVCTLLSCPMAEAWTEKYMPRDSDLPYSNYNWHGFVKYFANHNFMVNTAACRQCCVSSATQWITDSHDSFHEAGML